MLCNTFKVKTLKNFLSGTSIDTSIQEILSDGTVQEFPKNIGEASSAARVDADFKKFFHSLFGSEFSELYVKKYKVDFLDLQYEFELKKRLFDLESETGTTIELPASLVKMYTSKYKQSLQFMIDDTEYVGRILSQEDSIILEKSLMKDIFGPAIKSIMGYLTTLSRDPELKQCDAIILVGGFADSPVVSGAVKYFFPNSNIIMLKEAELAVLRGGVLLGHYPGPEIVLKTPFSYGLGMAVPFSDSTHPRNKRFVARNIQYCADVFQPHISGGKQYVTGDFSSPSRLKLNRPLQKRVAIPVYVSRHRYSKFTTDDHCSLLGKLYVNVPDQKEGRATVKVEMALLGDSIIVSGTDEVSDETTEASFPLVWK